MRKQSRKRRNKTSKLSYVVILAFLGSFLFLFAYSFYMESLFEKNYKPIAVSNDLKFPASMFQKGRAEFFNVSAASGPAIRFLVLKDSKGIVHTAFDTCRECLDSVLGYRQSRRYLICAHCDLKIEIEDSFHNGTRKCRPIPLKSTVQNDHVIIHFQDLVKGSEFFPRAESTIESNGSQSF